jgi:serine/threonine protein kinase
MRARRQVESVGEVHALGVPGKSCGHRRQILHFPGATQIARGTLAPVLEEASPSSDPEQQLQDALRHGYRVEHQLGAGGMGTVYLAEDLRHSRKVAIKVLRPEVAASMGAERFQREIQIAARLQHPNILSLIDSGATGTLLYYVMPYVEGSTLRVRLARDGELPIGEGLRLLREIADALAYAHGQGIVHRDIKPENVLFMAGHVQLADFGVAKALGDLGAGMAVTEGGIAVGSPGYMAPEAASGDTATDHRADIYSFGVLAYEVLAGQHPFPATGARQLILAHLTRDAQPLRRLRPNVPAELNDLVMHCLEKRPADRWQSAAEIAHRLDAMLASGATPSRERTHEVTVGRFRLTEAVCQRLQRSSFTPRMIGDEVEYLDNGARSDVLVCFVHAIGLDGADFEPHLRSLPYRGIAPTLYGFEPSRRRRFTLPLDDHIVLMRELLRDVASRFTPAIILVVGFSSGGDVALRLAAHAPAAPAVRVDGVLALGCNLALETCFVTRILARLEKGKGTELVRDLQALGNTIDGLDEWISVHAYLVRLLQKFQLQVDPLRAFARDVIAPFEEDTGDAFARMYREASAPERALRCLFEDSETCNRLLREVQLRNLDLGVLGAHYREGSLHIEPDTTHFDLLRPDLVSRHLDSLVGALAGIAGGRTPTLPKRPASPRPG